MCQCWFKSGCQVDVAGGRTHFIMGHYNKLRDNRQNKFHSDFRMLGLKGRTIMYLHGFCNQLWPENCFTIYPERDTCQKCQAFDFTTFNLQLRCDTIMFSINIKISKICN